MSQNPSKPLEGLRELDHAGDLAIEVVASSREELFGKALIALAWLMVELSEVRPTERRELKCKALDDVDLMHDLLAEALNLFLIDNFIWSSASVTENGDEVRASLAGEPLDRRRHQLLREIKAVTYHRLVVERDGALWRAQIIFDI